MAVIVTARHGIIAYRYAWPALVGAVTTTAIGENRKYGPLFFARYGPVGLDVFLRDLDSDQRAKKAKRDSFGP